MLSIDNQQKFSPFEIVQKCSIFDSMSLAQKILWPFLLILVFSGSSALAQRTYTTRSVLSSGNWYKIAIRSAGVYRIDIPFLKSLNVNTSNLNSHTIRVFGNGGWMLSERAGDSRIDDLRENAVWIEDGGDGILNDNDYVLFYAPGPDQWIRDSLSPRFIHKKHLYSDESFYYINIGGNATTISEQSAALIPNITVNTFNDRYFYELDSVNFLSSGRQWFGEEFSGAAGRPLSRVFNVPLPGLSQAPVLLSASCVARSLNSSSRFSVKVNGQQVSEIDIPAVGSGIYDSYARIQNRSSGFNASSSSLAVSFDYTPGSLNSQGWLDWFEINAVRSLALQPGEQLLFRHLGSVGPGRVADFVIGNTGADSRVWDITDPLSPKRMRTSLNGSQLHFINNCDSLREYIAFTNASLRLPIAVGKIANQNIHEPSDAGMLIVTHASLLQQAKELADYHLRRDQLTSVVVSTDQIFNEFASGSPDPVAIRDYVKMYYDRAGADSLKRPKYLLLFGHGSFDYKKRIPGNSNLVPVYESENSLDPLSTYTSDDFFGLLDDLDDINSAVASLLDIGVGRIPASTPQEAAAIVRKIIAYTDTASFGPWRNEMSFVADDEDNNLHLQDAEIITQSVSTLAPVFNTGKIYLDAFSQQSGAGGSRYPEVNAAIDNKMYSGNLVWNYNGHGGSRRLAEEVVLDQDIINSLENANRLPLFITATCDFAPHDNPQVRSIGEDLLLREGTGAIALMTTTRLVFAYSNRIMNRNYFETALLRKADGSYPSLGEAVRNAKNLTYQFSADIINNRKFTLLGDPALTIAYPRYDVKVTAINNRAISSIPDTLKAMGIYRISGEVTDHAGNLLTGFNGTLYPVIYDKPRAVNTLANDPGSIRTSFEAQKNTLFRGKTTVSNGKFNFEFMVPRDINYQLGNGKMGFYAHNDVTDANGVLVNILIGGSEPGPADREGPAIVGFMDNEQFRDGGRTGETPVLILKLSDTSGINIMGSGIGHDLVAVLDNDPSKRFVLNDFFLGEQDSYRRGGLQFGMPALAEGAHTLEITAWDVVNNSSRLTIHFRVEKKKDFHIVRLFNYPNPFTVQTIFRFETDLPPGPQELSIDIYTVTGIPVKSIRSTIISFTNRSNDVPWDGKDQYGRKLGKAVYIYRMRVQSKTGAMAQRTGKLYVF
jgi:hypothetical protein